MMKRPFASLLAFALLAIGTGPQLLAHEGHEHKVMGTVTMAAVDHVMLKDKDGKDVTIKLTEDTKVKAKPMVKVEEIKVGTRVAVTAVEGKNKSMTAKNIEVAVADWVGVAGEERPASVTKLSTQSAAGGPSGDTAAIEAWLKGYDAAFNAKDLDKLAAFYHPDVTIYEGGGINNGWIDYRDRHLGPELKAFENLQFGHSNTKVTVLPGGQSAYATSEYAIKAKMGERQLDSGGLETLVLVKSADGSWQIRHSRTSSRPARRPPA